MPSEAFEHEWSGSNTSINNFLFTYVYTKL